MATPTLGTLVYTSLSTAESTTGWVKFDLLETDIKKEGANSITGTFRADGTVGYYDAGGAPITGAGKHVRLWVNTTNLPYMQPEASGGYEFYMFDGSTTEYRTIFGADTYEGGWFNMVLDVDSFTTLTLANIDRWGMRANQASSAKNVDNMWVDALKYMDGYYATGGLTGDRIELAGLATQDTASGYGIILRVEGVYFAYGEVQIGNGATTTWFDMVGEVLIFTDSPVAAGLYKLAGVGTGCRVNIEGSVIKGGGTTDATRFIFDMSDPDVLACSVTDSLIVRAGAVTFKSGQTATGNTFDDCGQITPAGADLTDCVVSNYEGTAGTGAVYYNETSNPDGEFDGMSFTRGIAATHAIEFGPLAPTDMTLRNVTFAGGYSTGDGDNHSTIEFLRTTGTTTLNIVGGTIPTIKTTGTHTVVIVADPVTATVNVATTANVAIVGARVLLQASTGTGPLPYQDSVTLSGSGTVMTVTHSGHALATGQKVNIKGSTTSEVNGVKTVTVTESNAYTYASTTSGTPGGTITSTGVVLEGLTGAIGRIIDTRSYSSNQPVSGWARKGSVPPFYKTASINGVIDSASGLTANVAMVLDE